MNTFGEQKPTKTAKRIKSQTVMLTLEVYKEWILPDTCLCLFDRYIYSTDERKVTEISSDFTDHLRD